MGPDVVATATTTRVRIGIEDVVGGGRHREAPVTGVKGGNCASCTMRAAREDQRSLGSVPNAPRGTYVVRVARRLLL